MTQDPSRPLEPEAGRAPSGLPVECRFDADHERLRRRTAPFLAEPRRAGAKRVVPRLPRREVPRQAAEYEVSGSRAGGFFELSAASMALAGLAALHAPADRDASSRTSSSPRRSSPASPSSSRPPSRSAAMRRGLLAESHLGAPHEARGQPRPSGQPRRDRRHHPGGHPRSLRPRSLAGHHEARQHPDLERADRRARRRDERRSRCRARGCAS